MIKKSTSPSKHSDKKLKAAHRFHLILKKLQRQFQFKNLCRAFTRLSFSRRKQVQKFTIAESIKKRIVRQTFLTLNSYHKKIPPKDKFIQSLKKLSFTVLFQFFHQKQKANCSIAFKKIKDIPNPHNSSKIHNFTSILTSFSKHFQKRVFVAQTLGRLKKVVSKQNKLNQFFSGLDLYLKRGKQQHLKESFERILKEGFRRKYLDDLRRKQQKITAVKNFNLHKNQQYRLLRIEINTLTKTLQTEEASKTKNKKQDYDRNLILQAKSTQRQKNHQEFKKISFQNDCLIYELNKKQAYLKHKEELRLNSVNLEILFQKTYDYLNDQKTKQTLSFKEVSIYLNRENMDLNQILKKFGLSLENVLNENIDLRNLQNLYEKQMPGYGINVNIKESEAYRKTMEENLNLRQFLQILLKKMLSAQQRQGSEKREELSKVIEGHQSSQKGSKITITTLSSSTNGFSR